IEIPIPRSTRDANVSRSRGSAPRTAGRRTEVRERDGVAGRMELDLDAHAGGQVRVLTTDHRRHEECPLVELDDGRRVGHHERGVLRAPYDRPAVQRARATPRSWGRSEEDTS